VHHNEQHSLPTTIIEEYVSTLDLSGIATHHHNRSQEDDSEEHNSSENPDSNDLHGSEHSDNDGSDSTPTEQV
jgi:hypothetical protein